MTLPSPSTSLASRRGSISRRCRRTPLIMIGLTLVITTMIVSDCRSGRASWMPMTLVIAQADETEDAAASATTGAAEATASSSSSDEGGEGTATTSDTATDNIPPKPKPPKVGTFNVKDHLDWGTYYDPKNIFCGKYDCYRILGFDYESFGKDKPDTKVITKRYRALSREWHPDKSKHRDAKERFVKIARAYEVLTNVDTRKEYDALRYDQLAYFRKYGANVLWSYAPQSDTVLVVLFILVILNVFVYFAQYNKWQNVANRLMKAAVEDWPPSQGGTKESKELRDHALQIWQELEDAKDRADEAAAASGSGTTSNSKKMKLSAKEKRQKQNDELKPIIQELVYEMDDFGAGFHRPTWRDLLVVKMTYWPYHLAVGIAWQVKFYARRIQKLEWNDEERTVMTERAVGHVAWELSTEEERTAMIGRELWKLDNLAAWKEEQEIKKLSKSQQKYIAKQKKKGTTTSKDD